MSRTDELAYAIADVVAVLTDDTIACHPGASLLSLSMRDMAREYRELREQGRQFAAAIGASEQAATEQVAIALRAALSGGVR